MINAINPSNRISFGKNKADAAHEVGRFFEGQVKTGMVESFKPSLVDNLAARQMSGTKNNYAMSVTGYSGAGKTFFTQRAKEAVGNDIAILTGDCFYRDLSGEFAKVRKTPDGRDVTGFEGIVYGGYCLEGPHNFDTVRGAKKVESLKQGKTVYLDKYLMDNTGRVAHNAIRVKPASVILLDGICANFAPLKDVFDAKAFWQVPYQTIEQRYFHRGRSPFDEKLLANSQASGRKYIEPELSNMDIVFNGETAVENMKNFAKGFVALLKK